MKLLYNTIEGYELVRILALPFIIYYIESPIIASMHALNLTTKAFYSTVISSIIRILILVLLTQKFAISTVAIATLVSVFVDVIINGYFVIDRLFFHNEKIVL